MDKQDATARAERLVDMLYGLIQHGDVDHRAWLRSTLLKEAMAGGSITAALLAVQRETREACAQEILDRSRQRHASPYAWMSRVALEDCAQAIRGETHE